MPHQPAGGGAPRIPSMTPDERRAFARGFPVHVGVDTGRTFHVLVAAGPDGTRRKGVRVDVGREGFDKADRELTAAFPDIPRDRMLVGLELAGHHGVTFADFLAERGYHLVNVLPAATKKLKEVEDNSPRKDDAKDAFQICGMLKLGLFVLRYPPSETVAQMRVLTTERLRLTREETGLKNRLQAVLDVVWPEFLGVMPPLSKNTPRRLLERWPTPADLLAEPAARVRKAVSAASRSQVKRAKFDALLSRTTATIGVQSAQEARRAEIVRLMARWAVLQQQMAEIDARLAELVEQHPAAKALTTVAEVSHLCAATIVAGLGTPESYVSWKQVLKMAGMNLARKESGTSVRGRVKQTKRGRPGLRRQLFLIAGRWCSDRGHYRGYYLTLTQRNNQSKISAMCRGAEARAAAAARDADGRGVRPRALAGGAARGHEADHPAGDSEDAEGCAAWRHAAPAGHGGAGADGRRGRRRRLARPGGRDDGVARCVPHTREHR